MLNKKPPAGKGKKKSRGTKPVPEGPRRTGKREDRSCDEFNFFLNY